MNKRDLNNRTLHMALVLRIEQFLLDFFTDFMVNLSSYRSKIRFHRRKV